MVGFFAVEGSQVHNHRTNTYRSIHPFMMRKWIVISHSEAKDDDDCIVNDDDDDDALVLLLGAAVLVAVIVFVDEEKSEKYSIPFARRRLMENRAIETAK